MMLFLGCHDEPEIQKFCKEWKKELSVNEIELLEKNIPDFT